MMRSSQQGPVPVISLIPADFPAVAELSSFSFLHSSFSLHLHCFGVGFSLIDATPEENCYVYLDDVDASGVITEDSQEAMLNISCFQIDVSDFNAPFSTLVYVVCEEGEDSLPSEPSSVEVSVEPSPSFSAEAEDEMERSQRVSRKERKTILKQLKMEEAQTQQIVRSAELHEKNSVMSCASCGLQFRGGKRPFLHVCGKRHLQQKKTMFIDRGLASLQHIVLTVDEVFMERLTRVFGPFLSAAEPQLEPEEQSLLAFVGEQVFDATLLRGEVEKLSAISFFISQFTLLPVTFVVSLKSSIGHETDSVLDTSASTPNGFISCENMVIRLKEFHLQNMQGGYWVVFRAFRSYLVKEVLKQLYVFCGLLRRRNTLLSSVDLLGNLQYFRGKNQDAFQNLNYVGNSLQILTSLSVQQDVVPPLSFPSGRESFSSDYHPPRPKGFVKAVGSAVDGIAHIGSKVGTCAEPNVQFTRGIGSSLSSLAYDNQFCLNRAIRLNQNTEESFGKSSRE